MHVASEGVEGGGGCTPLTPPSISATVNCFILDCSSFRLTTIRGGESAD